MKLFITSDSLLDSSVDPGAGISLTDIGRPPAHIGRNEGDANCAYIPITARDMEQSIDSGAIEKFKKFAHLACHLSGSAKSIRED